MTPRARFAFHVRLCSKAGLLRKPVRKTRVDAAAAVADEVAIAADEAVTVVVAAEIVAAVVVTVAGIAVLADSHSRIKTPRSISFEVFFLP